MLNDFVDRCVWAADLSPEQRERVRRAMFVHEYSQGDYVCHKGDIAEHWMGVLEGIVKITTVSPSGKSVTFTGVPTGGWFGEGAVLKSEIRKYDVMALRRSTIAFLPRDTFQWLLDTSLPFTRFLLHQPLGGVQGQASDITIEAEEIIKMRARLIKEIATETGQPYEKVVADTERNFWMGAEEAQKYGLVNKIITSASEI